MTNEPDIDPPGVVIDCVVFLQAAVNEESAAARILNLLDEGRIELYVSKRVLAELRHTLDRADLRSRIKGLTDLAVEGLFERLEKKTTFIKQIPRRFEYPRDPKDEPYISFPRRVLQTPRRATGPVLTRSSR